MKYVATGVSFPIPGLLDAAKARAKSLRLNLSQYICRLIEEDLNKGGNFVLRPVDSVDHGVYMAEDSPTAPEADPPPSSLVAAWAHGVRHADLREIQAHVTGKPSPDSGHPTTSGAPPRSPAPGTSSSSPVHKGISYGGTPSPKTTDHPPKSKGQK